MPRDKPIIALLSWANYKYFYILMKDREKPSSSDLYTHFKNPQLHFLDRWQRLDVLQLQLHT